MKCFKCGSVLSANDTCDRCGADVSVYKKTARLSSCYYNRGLEKAQVRDLTGAIQDLKISLMINKYNIQARNLLGLIYCEMGDVVDALSQWVISKNFAKDDNVADSYIRQVQANQTKFEAVTNSIKKYNISLQYAKEGNTDMAIIQLKKITAANPHFVRAYQLLALLYIKEEEYQRAKKLLNAVLRIDHSNTIAQRYLTAIGEEINLKNSDVANSFLPKKKEKEVSSTPLNGNDVILPRTSYKEPSNGAITIVNVLLGVVIGAALVWFLIIPARYEGLTADYNRQIADYSEQLSSGNVELNDLTRQLEQVNTEKEALQTQLEQVNSTEGSNKYLIAVIESASAYIANDSVTAAEKLLDIDVSALPSDTAKTLYNTIASAAMPVAATSFYSAGMQDYYKSAFDTAAQNFSKAYKCNSNNANAAYYAAKCYVALAQTDNAKKYYQYIVDDFPTSSYYREASDYVASH